MCFILINYGSLQGQNNLLFKNPLIFYNTDILNYLQILYKNQQYNNMAKFIYGPKIEKLKGPRLVEALANSKFGYKIKRVGIAINVIDSWSLTYQRSILGTEEVFHINCKLVNDTCKMYLDDKVWQTVFSRKLNLDN